MKWFDALLYQIYWYEVELWGRRDVIDWVILAIFFYSHVLNLTLGTFLQKKYHIDVDWLTASYTTDACTIAMTIIVSIYLLRRKRYRKIFTNHEEFDSSWARSIFRTFIISFVIYLFLLYEILTSR